MNVLGWKHKNGNQQTTHHLTRSINRREMEGQLDLHLSGDGGRAIFTKCNVMLPKAPNELKVSKKSASSFNIGLIKCKRTNIIPCTVYSEPVLKRSIICYYKKNGEENCQVSVFPPENPNLALSLTANIQNITKCV